MKDSKGTSQQSSVLKSLYDGIQDILCCHIFPNNYKRLDVKLERKMMEIKRSTSGHSNFKSIDSIILKFPQFREGLKEIRGVFEQYDEDSNGTIDHEELKKCLHTLQFPVREEAIDDLYYYCDMNENEGIQFNEFIVLLCLIYLLTDSSASSHASLQMCSQKIEATFNTIIEVFLFLDKNGDGRLKRKDVIKALNESSPREKSPSHVTRSRFSYYSTPKSNELWFGIIYYGSYFWHFKCSSVNYAEEMDWDRNGKVSFKEFLFAFISWVGIDSDDEGPE